MDAPYAGGEDAKAHAPFLGGEDVKARAPLLAGRSGTQEAQAPYLGEDNAPGLTPWKELPPVLLEPTLFTDEQRAQQRARCGRACGWLPVVYMT